MFGEVLPQALNIFPTGNPSHTVLPLAPFSDATEQQLAAFKATAWRSTTGFLLPQQATEGGRRHRMSEELATEPDVGGDRLRMIVQQLLRMLESASAATVCGGARALRCVAEARAHAVHVAGEEYSEDPRITDLLMVCCCFTLERIFSRCCGDMSFLSVTEDATVQWFKDGKSYPLLRQAAGRFCVCFGEFKQLCVTTSVIIRGGLVHCVRLPCGGFQLGRSFGMWSISS